MLLLIQCTLVHLRHVDALVIVQVSTKQLVLTQRPEGVKLNMKILESRLSPALSENQDRPEFVINSLRLKVTEMEGVVRYQDETICRLNGENMSKLMSLEKLTLNEPLDYQTITLDR